MKVLKKAVIALSLAAPLQLVSANELVIELNAHAVGDKADIYTRDIKEVPMTTPMSFKDIIVIAPRLDSSVIVKEPDGEATYTRDKDRLSGAPEIAISGSDLIMGVNID